MDDIVIPTGAPKGNAKDLRAVLDHYFAVPGIRLEAMTDHPEPENGCLVFFRQRYSIGENHGQLVAEIHDNEGFVSIRAWHVHQERAVELNLTTSRYGEETRGLLERMLDRIRWRVMRWAFGHTSGE